MALEDEMKALRESVEKLTEVTTKLLEVRTDAVETVRSAAAPKGKAADKATDKPKETPAAETKSADTISEETAKKMQESIAAYVSGSDREEERTARKTKIRSLLRHEKICLPEFRDNTETYDAMHVMPSAVELFFEQVRLLNEKGDLTEAPKASGGALDI